MIDELGFTRLVRHATATAAGCSRCRGVIRQLLGELIELRGELRPPARDERRCATCGGTFRHPPARGRPPSRCPACREIDRK